MERQTQSWVGQWLQKSILGTYADPGGRIGPEPLFSCSRWLCVCVWCDVVRQGDSVEKHGVVEVVWGIERIVVFLLQAIPLFLALPASFVGIHCLSVLSPLGAGCTNSKRISPTADTFGANFICSPVLKIYLLFFFLFFFLLFALNFFFPTVMIHVVWAQSGGKRMCSIHI